jgi:hypothetical protein
MKDHAKKIAGKIMPLCTVHGSPEEEPRALERISAVAAAETQSDILLKRTHRRR